MQYIIQDVKSVLNKSLEDVGRYFGLKDFGIVEEVEGETYVDFPHDGIELILDGDVSKTIFLYSEGYEGRSGYKGGIDVDISFSSSRDDVRSKLGNPESSNDNEGQQKLGFVPLWDKYHIDGHYVHFQYSQGGNSISLISLIDSEPV